MQYYVEKTPWGKDIYFYLTDTHRISFSADIQNTDYQDYLKWVAEGNEPQPAE